MISKLILPIIAVGMLAFAVNHMRRVHEGVPPVQPLVAPPQAPFKYAIAAYGLVEAQTENIAVSPTQPGLVTQVEVVVGQKVAEKAPLFRLDDRHLQAQLKVRQAEVTVAEATLKKLEKMPRPEELPVVEARVNVAKATLADQEDMFKRAKQLVADAALPSEELTRRRFAVEVARAQVEQAEAELKLLKAGAWELEKAIARARLDLAKAQVQQIQEELKRLVVCAPIGGEILQVNVRVGEFAATPAVQPLILLGNVQKLHLRVDIDEEDIPRFRSSAKAVGFIRGSPQRRYALTLIRVEPSVIPKRSLTGGSGPERVDTRVQQVLYAIEQEGSQPMYVGQQLDVFIEAEPLFANGGKK